MKSDVKEFKECYLKKTEGDFGKALASSYVSSREVS